MMMMQYEWVPLPMSCFWSSSWQRRQNRRGNGGGRPRSTETVARNYLFIPAIICQFYQLFTHSFAWHYSRTAGELTWRTQYELKLLATGGAYSAPQTCVVGLPPLPRTPSQLSPLGFELTLPPQCWFRSDATASWLQYYDISDMFVLCMGTGTAHASL